VGDGQRGDSHARNQGFMVREKSDLKTRWCLFLELVSGPKDSYMNSGEGIRKCKGLRQERRWWDREETVMVGECEHKEGAPVRPRGKASRSQQTVGHGPSLFH